MDTTPVSNQINVQISFLMEDPVTSTDNGIAAGLDGVIYSSVRRNKYVAEAERELIGSLVGRLGYDGAADELQGTIATQSVTTSASGVTLNKDFMFAHRFLFNGIEALYVPVKGKLDQDLDPYLNYGFTIFGNKLFFYKRVAGVMTASAGEAGEFHYFAAHRVDSTTGADVAVNTAPDISLGARWYDFLTLYGAARASFDAVSAIADPDPGMAEKGNRFLAMALEKLPSGQSLPNT